MKTKEECIVMTYAREGTFDKIGLICNQHSLRAKSITEKEL